jgi:hypothetical protein
MVELSDGEGFRTENLLCGMAEAYVNRKTHIRAFGVTINGFHGNNIPIWIYFNVQL